MAHVTPLSLFLCSPFIWKTHFVAKIPNKLPRGSGDGTTNHVATPQLSEIQPRGSKRDGVCWCRILARGLRTPLRYINSEFLATCLTFKLDGSLSPRTQNVNLSKPPTTSFNVKMQGSLCRQDSQQISKIDSGFAS